MSFIREIATLFRSIIGSANQEKVHAKHELTIADIPRYPPFDRGLPLISPDDLIRSQQEIIDRIRQTAGLTPEEYEQRIFPVIKNLARYVHLLPATDNSHHRGAGGLFRLALELGLYSLQKANATIFTSKGAASVESRYKLQPKWMYATFLAALCAELYRPITMMVVVDDEGTHWPQMTTPLYEWALNNDKERYFIVWNILDAEEISMHQSNSSHLFHVVVPRECLQYINEDNSEIMPSMLTCLTGAVKPGAQNQINAIVSTIRNKIIDRDLKRSSDRYGEHLVGAHLAPHLIDAMRRLVRKGTWTVNDKGARIWYSNEGMFLVWQAAAKEVLALLAEDLQSGIPQDSNTLADMLINNGIASANDEDGRYWDICEPLGMKALLTIKLTKTEILFPEGFEFSPTTTTLLISNKTEAESTAQSEPQSVTLSPAIAVEQPVVKKAETPQKTAASAETVPVDMPVKGAARNDELTIEMFPSQSIGPTSSPTKVNDIQSKSDAPVQDIGTPSQANANRFFESLKLEESEFLRAVVSDHQNNQQRGPVFSIENGMAISIDELSAHDPRRYTALIKTLNDKGWLWMDPENPMRYIHPVKYEEQKLPVIIIRPDIACRMGFQWSKPPKEKVRHAT